MSTPNFKYPNTRKHYVIGIENDLEDWEYDDILENIKSELENIKLKDIDGGPADEWLDREEHAFYKFTIPVYDQYYKEWDSASLYVTIESGYYQGAISDIDKSEITNLEVSKSTQAKVDRLWARIERILEANTTPLVRTATFSNGEAIYERADSQRAIIKAIVGGYL